MRNLIFKISLFALCSFSIVACSDRNSDVTPDEIPTAADKFIGSYMGEYAESGTNGSFTVEDQSAVVTKKADKEVVITLTVVGISINLNGVVENETTVKITNQKYLNNDITSGTATLQEGKNLSVKLMTKEAASNETVEVSYVGKK